MKVVYVSEALTVAAYRSKLTALGRHLEVTGVMPARWGFHRIEELDPTGPRIRKVDVWFGGHSHFHAYRGIIQVIRNEKPDLVHIDEEPYSLVTTQIAHSCLRANIPSLFFSWQNLHKTLPPPFSAMRRYVFRTVEGGIAGTDQAACVLRRAGYAGPLAVIPQFGVDSSCFAPDPNGAQRLRDRLSLRDVQAVIGFGGRLIPEKGVHLLIDALVELPTAALVVLGDGPQRKALENLAIARGVAHRVRWVGAVPSTEMPWWVSGLDILALPSLRTRGWVEQFGRILVEAMACAIPTVGTDAGEIPNVIRGAGLTFRENDLAALVAALRRLIDDPGLRLRLGTEGRNRVSRHFTHDRIAAQTSEFYQRVVARS